MFRYHGKLSAIACPQIDKKCHKPHCPFGLGVFALAELLFLDIEQKPKPPTSATIET